MTQGLSGVLGPYDTISKLFEQRRRYISNIAAIFHHQHGTLHLPAGADQTRASIRWRLCACPRQIDRDHGATARFTGHRYRPARLVREAVHLREAEACALADWFRCVEGL